MAMILKSIKIEHGALPDDPVGMHPRHERLSITAAAAATVKQEKLWNYPVDIHSMELLGTIDGDDAALVDPLDEIWAYADTGDIGALTADKLTGATILNVEQTVIDALDLGDHITIAAQTDVYEIVGINDDTNQITISPALAHDHSTDDTVNMRRYFVGIPGEGIRVGTNPCHLRLGDMTYDSSRLPTGKKLTVEYKNNGSVEKTILGQLNILY